MTFSYEKWLREPDLNRRPSGYEPDELPNCSIPRPYNALAITIFIPLLKNWLREPDLNQRPSGYEPDELPNCSIPRPYNALAITIFIPLLKNWLREPDYFLQKLGNDLRLVYKELSPSSFYTAPSRVRITLVK